MATNEVMLYLFGDQTYNVGPHLKELLLSSRQGNSLMNDFLRRSYDAVRAELYRLPSQEQELLPRFIPSADPSFPSPSTQPPVFLLDDSPLAPSS